MENAPIAVAHARTYLQRRESHEHVAHSIAHRLVDGASAGLQGIESRVECGKINRVYIGALDEEYSKVIIQLAIALKSDIHSYPIVRRMSNLH